MWQFHLYTDLSCDLYIHIKAYIFGEYVILSKNVSYGYFSSYNFADAICLGYYPKNVQDTI